MTKPRLRRDIYYPSGWICWSKHFVSGRIGYRRIIGSGFTPEQAYRHWSLQNDQAQTQT